MSWGRWRPYVSVGQRQANARKEVARQQKKGRKIEPVVIEGRTIAKTFWGKGWCDHVESFHDYSNRLPRGRTYVRNGSVCHLSIKKGKITAMVSGSDLYEINIKIKPLSKKKWNRLKKQCTGKIGSLLELLQGKLSDSIMKVVTDPKNGLFPLSKEISFDCDCPDWASMCKHIAAVFYGVGARLDTQPELLFLLRGVDHEELITADAETAVSAAMGEAGGKHLGSDDLADIFGIDIEQKAVKKSTKKAASKKSPKKKTTKKKAAKKTVKKKSVKKKSTKKTSVKKKVVKKKAATKTPVNNPVKKKSVKKSTPKKKVPKKRVVKKAAKKVVRKSTKKRSAKKKGTARKKRTQK